MKNEVSVSDLKKSAIRGTVKLLLIPNNTITTLEVKEKLREGYKTLEWKQSLISDTLDEMYQEGELTYIDNGTYRTYSLPVAVEKVKLTKKQKRAAKKDKIKDLLVSLSQNTDSQGLVVSKILKLAELLKVDIVNV